MVFLCSYCEHITNLKRTMKNRGQPKKEIKRASLKLTILPKVKEVAEKLAFEQNKSISRLFEDLLLQEMRKQSGLEL